MAGPGVQYLLTYLDRFCQYHNNSHPHYLSQKQLVNVYVDVGKPRQYEHEPLAQQSVNPAAKHGDPKETIGI